MPEATDIPKGFKIVEHPIDGNNTVLRKLVPVDTVEEDTPEGSILLSESESAGILSRQARPEIILKGDMVRLREGKFDTSKNVIRGTVTAKLKSGKFEVSWSDGTKGRYEAKELAVFY